VAVRWRENAIVGVDTDVLSAYCSAISEYRLSAVEPTSPRMSDDVAKSGHLRRTKSYEILLVIVLTLYTG
jgi:hypothetical protein